MQPLAISKYAAAASSTQNAVVFGVGVVDDGQRSNLWPRMLLVSLAMMKGGVPQPTMLYNIGSATVPKQRGRGILNAGRPYLPAVLEQGITSGFGEDKEASTL